MSEKIDIDSRIGGIHRAAEIMRANAADEFDRAFCGRVANELNREITHLQKLALTPPAEWVPQPPQPCPMKETPSSCYRRDGETSTIDAGLQGKLCKGCERRVSTLDGLTP